MYISCFNSCNFLFCGLKKKIYKWFLEYCKLTIIGEFGNFGLTFIQCMCINILRIGFIWRTNSSRTIYWNNIILEIIYHSCCKIKVYLQNIMIFDVGDSEAIKCRVQKLFQGNTESCTVYFNLIKVLWCY